LHWQEKFDEYEEQLMIKNPRDRTAQTGEIKIVINV